jgi:hypothetical protein
MQDFPSWESAQSELAQLGLDPAQPYNDLNLAGSQGVPSPRQLAQPSRPQSAVNDPTFSKPNFSVPSLERADLSEPGVTLHVPFTPDPLLLTSDEYTQPSVLDIVTGQDSRQVLAPASDEDAAPSELEMPPGFGFSMLNVNPGVATPDPLVPDMQQPTLAPQVTMQERPADMDASTLSDLDDELLSELLTGKGYPGVQMDQRGNNAARARHLTLLTDGLLDEEA